MMEPPYYIVKQIKRYEESFCAKSYNCKGRNSHNDVIKMFTT